MEKKSFLRLATLSLVAGVALAGFASSANAGWFDSLKKKVSGEAKKVEAKGKVAAEHAAGKELGKVGTQLQNAKE